MFFQQNDPFIVTVIQRPEHQMTVLDLFLGSFLLTILAILAGMLLGVVFGFVLVRWNRRRRPEDNRMPSISPLLGPRPPTPPVR